MEDFIYSGIDIGSQNIKIISIAYNKENKTSKIIAKSTYQSRGVKNGYINNKTLFLQSMTDALKKYKNNYKIDIKEAVVTISSLGLKSRIIKINHQVIEKNAISEVDLLEIERKTKRSLKTSGNYILDLRFNKFKIKGYDYFSKDVLKLDAKKIESEYISIEMPKNHFTLLEDVFTKLNIIILDINSGNLMSAEHNTEIEDRDFGFININIGSDLTSYSIWENNKIIFLDHIKFGGEDITNLIAVEEQVNNSEAEHSKRKNLLSKQILKKISFQLNEIIQEINKNLEELDLLKLLPGGIVLYGGGARFDLVKENFKKGLSMPVKNNKKHIFDSQTDYDEIYASLMMFIKQDISTKPLISIKGFLNLFKRDKK